MNKNHLVDALVEKVGLSRNDASVALDVLIEEVIQGVARGEVLKIRGFGTFSAVRRKARKGYNIHTKEVRTLPEKNIPKFSPGKLLTDAAATANVQFYEDGEPISGGSTASAAPAAPPRPARPERAVAPPTAPPAPKVERPIERPVSRPVAPPTAPPTAKPAAPPAPPAAKPAAPAAPPAKPISRPKIEEPEFDFAPTTKIDLKDLDIPDLETTEEDLPPSLEDFPGPSESLTRTPPQPSTPSATVAPSAPVAPAPPPKAPKQDYSADPEHLKAQRIARTLVSDLKLYFPDDIAKALKSGNFFKAMEKILKDPRAAYERRVPERVRRERDYLAELLDELAGK